MTSTEGATDRLSEAEHSRQLRRAVVASTVGTVIEAYDFLLYVLVAPLVFAKLYFPASDPLSATQPTVSNTASPSLSPSEAETTEDVRQADDNRSLWDKLLAVFR